MRKSAWIYIILFFLTLPFTARAEEWGEATYRREKTASSLLDNFLNANRKPLIRNDNLIFGYPEYLDAGIGFAIGFEDTFWVGMNLQLDYTAGPFRVSADILFINDQKYAPAAVMIPSGSLGGFYFMLVEGGLSYKNDFLHINAGRYRNYDEVNSPYSLFLNSMGHSANTLKFRLESNHFIYQTQWIQLNWNNAASSPAWNEYQRRLQSPDGFYYPALDPDTGLPYDPWNTKGIPYGFPDRGVNFKVYGLKVHDWRIGFLDAAVYSGRAFDLEYLLSPIPMYFTQYFRATGGRPWATENNDNALIGLFWDIDKSDWDAYAQVLVDDFSLGFLRFMYPGFSRNPWKAAWAMGGRVETPVGRFGFHHGGALKYTFNPIGTDDGGRYKDDSAASAYGYTYYPETRYYNGNKDVFLLIEDNMVGYKWGENNLAFQVDYQRRFSGFLVTAELELVLAGNNSPANPWQDYDARSSMYDDGKYGSQLFHDGQIEKRLEFRVNVSRQFGMLAGYFSLAVGGRFNKLVLKPPKEDPYTSDYPNRTVDDLIWIWKATNKHEAIFRFSLGFIYKIPVL